MHTFFHKKIELSILTNQCTLFFIKKLKFTHNDNLNYIIYKIIVNILIDKWKYQILV
jgi:hypothetical protein